MSTLSKWIDSNGGPLILMEARLAPHWTGLDGNDYDRACEVNDYLGVLTVGDGQALVLGEYMSTAWIANSDGGTFVQWSYGESQSAVLEALNGAISELPKLDTEPVRNIEFKDKHLLLFDSAYPGYDAVTEFLGIEIDVGTYSVDVVEYTPNSKTRLYLFRLVKHCAPPHPWITPEDITEASQNAVFVHEIDLSCQILPREVIAMISPLIARKYGAIPIAFGTGVLKVAIADMGNLNVVDDLRFLLNCEVSPVVAPETQIRAALDKYYPL